MPICTSPLAESEFSVPKTFWMVGCAPASSTSSQWAPSKTGVETQAAGSVRGRVLRAAPSPLAEVPTPSFTSTPSQPWRAA